MLRLGYIDGYQLSQFSQLKVSLFQVPFSNGPGRYVEAYENKGQDYPLGFVCWIEKRNVEAIESEHLDVESLIN